MDIIELKVRKGQNYATVMAKELSERKELKVKRKKTELEKQDDTIYPSLNIDCYLIFQWLGKKKVDIAVFVDHMQQKELKPYFLLKHQNS